MKVLKRILLGLMAIVVMAAGSVYAASSVQIGQTIVVDDPAPAVHSDSATVVRGEYLARAIAKCADCHGEDLGGATFIDGGPLGVFRAPNLTSGTGGILAKRSDAEIITAIRHGVAPGGRKLPFMPVAAWSGLADEDVTAIVAYLRSVPPVDRELASSQIGPLGRALVVAGKLPLFEADHIPHSGITRVKPPAGPTAEYGAYIAQIGGCTGCHGPTLSGGKIPGTPPEFKPASNITPEGIGHYTEADFFRALREGRRPDGSAIDPLMPVQATKLMTDDDTRAVYAYLKTVPAKDFGGR